MRSEDLKITESDGAYLVEVSGRANFDYAVPLRELSGKLTESTKLQIDLSNCEAMDSTSDEALMITSDYNFVNVDFR